MKHRLVTCLFALPVGFLVPGLAAAFSIAITPGAKAIYLRVGAGTSTGNYNTGGSGGYTSVISQVQATVPAASLGQGPVGTVVGSANAESFYDGAVFCDSATQVYIGGYYRGPIGSGAGTLSVTSPASLTNASADTLSFGTISWTATTRGGITPAIADASFAPGTTQFLRSVAGNTYFEDCLGFSYANSSPLVKSGTYQGRVTYTLVVP